MMFENIHNTPILILFLLAGLSSSLVSSQSYFDFSNWFPTWSQDPWNNVVTFQANPAKRTNTEYKALSQCSSDDCLSELCVTKSGYFGIRKKFLFQQTQTAIQEKLFNTKNSHQRRNLDYDFDDCVGDTYQILTLPPYANEIDMMIAGGNAVNLVTARTYFRPGDYRIKFESRSDITQYKVVMHLSKMNANHVWIKFGQYDRHFGETHLSEFVGTGIHTFYLHTIPDKELTLHIHVETKCHIRAFIAMIPIRTTSSCLAPANCTQVYRRRNNVFQTLNYGGGDYGKVVDSFWRYDCCFVDVGALLFRQRSFREFEMIGREKTEHSCFGSYLKFLDRDFPKTGDNSKCLVGNLIGPRGKYLRTYDQNYPVIRVRVQVIDDRSRFRLFVNKLKYPVANYPPIIPINDGPTKSQDSAPTIFPHLTNVQLNLPQQQSDQQTKKVPQQSSTEESGQNSISNMQKPFETILSIVQDSSKNQASNQEGPDVNQMSENPQTTSSSNSFSTSNAQTSSQSSESGSNLQNGLASIIVDGLNQNLEAGTTSSLPDGLQSTATALAHSSSSTSDIPAQQSQGLPESLFESLATAATNSGRPSDKETQTSDSTLIDFESIGMPSSPNVSPASPESIASENMDQESQQHPVTTVVISEMPTVSVSQSTDSSTAESNSPARHGESSSNSSVEQETEAKAKESDSQNTFDESSPNSSVEEGTETKTKESDSQNNLDESSPNSSVEEGAATKTKEIDSQNYSTHPTSDSLNIDNVGQSNNADSLIDRENPIQTPNLKDIVQQSFDGISQTSQQLLALGDGNNPNTNQNNNIGTTSGGADGDFDSIKFDQTETNVENIDEMMGQNSMMTQSQSGSDLSPIFGQNQQSFSFGMANAENQVNFDLSNSQDSVTSELSMNSNPNESPDSNGLHPEQYGIVEQEMNGIDEQLQSVGPLTEQFVENEQIKPNQQDLDVQFSQNTGNEFSTTEENGQQIQDQFLIENIGTTNNLMLDELENSQRFNGGFNPQPVAQEYQIQQSKLQELGQTMPNDNHFFNPGTTELTEINGGTGANSIAFSQSTMNNPGNGEMNPQTSGNPEIFFVELNDDVRSVEGVDGNLQTLQTLAAPANQMPQTQANQQAQMGPNDAMQYGEEFFNEPNDFMQQPMNPLDSNPNPIGPESIGPYQHTNGEQQNGMGYSGVIYSDEIDNRNDQFPSQSGSISESNSMNGNFQTNFFKPDPFYQMHPIDQRFYSKSPIVYPSSHTLPQMDCDDPELKFFKVIFGNHPMRTVAQF
ncbi:testis-specific serine/threonine-protein kinase 1-like [Sarcoptes scabiei]|nr:testis-specific serine/threonine-protein kinase 1-like [Sarcoptes scabiei]